MTKNEKGMESYGIFVMFAISMILLELGAYAMYKSFYFNAVVSFVFSVIFGSISVYCLLEYIEKVVAINNKNRENNV